LTVDDPEFERKLSGALERLVSEVDGPFDANAIAASAMRRRFGSTGGFLALVGAALVLVVAALQLRPTAEPTPSGLGSSGGSPPVLSQSPEIEPVEALRLDTVAYDLTYDRLTDSLWLGTMRGDGPDFLYRIDATSSQVESWQLPETLHNGFLSEVEVAEDGGIWISYEYLLVRFDPETAAMATHRFPTGGFGFGAWISGLGTAGDSVWVARNGLSTLALFDPTMHQTSRLELPASFIGAEDVAASGTDVYVVRPGRDDGQGNVSEWGVGIFSADGGLEAFAAVQATRLEVIDGRVLARGGDSIPAGTAWVGVDGTVLAVEPGSYHLVGTAASPDVAFTYEDPHGPEPALIELHEAGSTTIIAAFPKEALEGGDWCVGPFVPGPSGSPAGVPSCPPLWVGAPDITGMAVDASGAVWYVENTGQGSTVWTLPGSLR
jgi:hypothetical protein